MKWLRKWSVMIWPCLLLLLMSNLLEPYTTWGRESFHPPINRRFGMIGSGSAISVSISAVRRTSSRMIWSLKHHINLSQAQQKWCKSEWMRVEGLWSQLFLQYGRHLLKGLLQPSGHGCKPLNSQPKGFRHWQPARYDLHLFIVGSLDFPCPCCLNAFIH